VLVTEREKMTVLRGKGKGRRTIRGSLDPGAACFAATGRRTLETTGIKYKKTEGDEETEVRIESKKKGRGEGAKLRIHSKSFKKKRNRTDKKSARHN